MAETRIIGAVAVKVRPEVGGFRRKTKAGILRQLKDVDAKVEVDVDVDLDKFRRQLGRLEDEAKNSKVHIGVELDGLKEAFRELRNEVARNSDATVELTAKLGEKGKRHVRKQIDDIIDDNSGKEIDLDAVAQTAGAATHLKWLTRDRFVNVFARVNKRSVAIAEGVLQSLAGWGVLSSAGRGVESLITNFDTLTVKAGAWGTALGGLTDSLSYMLTSALSVADGLVELMGLTAMAPALIAALGATVAINIAAWKNFGDAVNGDAEALAKLPPNAQAAAKSLQGAWTAIQKPVQKRFWEGMGTELADLAKVIVPQFAKGLADSAEGVGEFGAGVAKAMKTIALNGDLKKMFKGLDGFFENLAKGAEPLIDALNTLGLRGSEYLPKFGTWLADAAKKFDKFITAADEAGDINRWIEDGVTALQDLGRVTLGVKDMFMGLVEAAQMATGYDGLTKFADTLQRIGGMMRSEPFRSRMAEIFSGANEGATALNEGVKQLGRTLGESSGFLSELLTGLGELGGNVLKNVSRAIAQADFQSGLLDAVDGLNKGVKDLEPTFENLGKLIGSLGSIAGSVFQNVAPLLNDLSSLLVDVVQKIGPGLSGLAGTVADVLGGALSAVTPLISGIATGLGFLLDKFNALPAPIKNVATALAVIASLKFTGVFSSLTSGVTSAVDKAKAKLDQLPKGASKATAGVKAAFGGLSGALGGPWGIAIGALVGVISAVGAESAKQAAHVDALADSLDGLKASAETAKIIGEAFSGDKWNFSKSAGSTADAASRLGVSLEDLQDAALGSDDAMGRINDKLGGGLSWAGRVVKDARDTAEGMKKIDIAGQEVDATYGGTSPFAGWLAGFAQTDSDRVLNSIEAQRDAMEAAREKAVQLAEMKGIDASWALEYSDAVDKLGDSASNSLERLKALMDASRIKAGVEVDLGDYEQAFNDTKRTITSKLNEIRNELKESGKELDISKYLNKDGTVDTASRIGSEIRSMMKSFSTDGVTAAALFADSMNSPAEKVEDFKKRMATLREEFNKKFDLDLNTDEFNAVLKGLGIDPVEIETQLNEGNLKGEVKSAADGAKSETTVTIKAKVQDALGEIRVLKGEMERVSFHQYLASIGIDSTQFDAQTLDVLAQLMGFDVMSVAPTIDADDAGFEYTEQGVRDALRIIDETRAEAQVDAKDDASGKVDSASGKIKSFGDLSSTAHVKAKDSATAVVVAAKAVVKSFVGKTVTVLAKFVETAYTAIRTKINDIKAKTVQVLARFIESAYSSVRSKINDIKAKTVRILGNFIASGYTGLRSAISNIKGKTVTVTAVFKSIGKAVGAATGLWANGGLVGANGLGMSGPGFNAFKAPRIKAFADGGVESHVAQISRSTASTPIRIWAEPETGGEAYIPLSPSKRQRSLAIWKETGRRLGADFYEDGGVSGGGAGKAGPTFNITNHYPVAEKTSTTVNRALQYASIPGLSND
ncbi:hypothetical protein AUR04nite_00580 [Glutamicibacter uratoxydans]|uniref:Tape measure protein n=1 Tax=Glutamicibacter uratoxydans TaxID=43667 RepID=A0A4Y4DHL9_GLUUR|nr:hypothetical protein [Glutamicibacter uratoxydans]GED04526.1 hypothetical protein AUR04nite_00580 [Glutamicibacter uratoxydans]